MITAFDSDSRTLSTGIRDLIGFLWLPASLRPFEQIDILARQKMHNQYQRRMEKKGWRREVPVSLELSADGVTFMISGRADLVLDTDDGLMITEVKTCSSPCSDRDPVKHNLDHVLQLFFYAIALLKDSEYPQDIIHADLVYIPQRNIAEPEAVEIDIHNSGLRRKWNDMLGSVARELNMQEERHECQLKALETFSCPFPRTRPGQDDMIDSISETIVSGERILIQAPAGIGKTGAVLTGAIPDAIRQNLALFFLTAKNTQKKIVAETLRRIAGKGLHLRALFLTARETVCLSGSEFCLPDKCPWAEVFADRVREHNLLEKLLALEIITPENLVEHAEEAGVCPFELSLTLSTRCDLIVCDYNYVFDPHTFLRRFFLERSTACRCSILIDEAANLPARAREYYSPQIRLSWLEALRPFEKKHRKPFRALLDPWRKLFRELGEKLAGTRSEIELLPDMKLPLKEQRWRKVMPEQQEITSELRNMSRAVFDFARIEEIKDDRFHLLLFRENSDIVLQWLCTDASEFLETRHNDCHSTVAFSATLTPFDHYIGLLGLGESTRTAAMTRRIPYPFPRENLGVWIDTGLDTRYGERRGQLPLLVSRITGIADQIPGTWMVFFPSYSYLGMTAAMLEQRGTSVLCQQPGMKPDARRSFIDLVEEGSHIVFTVSGGIFAEGVDLRIPDCRGAMIVGPSLPGVDLRTRLLSDRFESLGEDGFLHTWVIPGMNRVVQAAGRLVRSSEDRRILILLGRRFALRPYVHLLPSHWFRSGSIDILPGKHDVLCDFLLREHLSKYSAPPGFGDASCADSIEIDT